LGQVDRSQSKLFNIYIFMNNCLIVLHPREIPECVKSIAYLPIDKLYMKAFSEPELVEPINDFIKNTNYDNYLILSDDVIVSRKALFLVEQLLENHEAATGYCLMSQDTTYANVTRGPLRQSVATWPVLEDYDFYDIEEIRKFQNPEFCSWFGGWCLTGFQRGLWLENPFRVMSATGCQSDYATCILYNKPIMCHRDAYVEHLRLHVDGPCKRNWLVGKQKPEMIHEVKTNLYNCADMEKGVAYPTSVKLLPFV